MIHLVRMHLMNKNEKRISQHFFAIFFSIKFVSKAQTCNSPKAIPTSKTETKFIVLLPPHSLKHILTHLVILSKHVAARFASHLDSFKILYGVKSCYTEYLLGIALLSRIVLEIGILVSWCILSDSILTPTVFFLSLQDFFYSVLPRLPHPVCVLN